MVRFIIIIALIITILSVGYYFYAEKLTLNQMPSTNSQMLTNESGIEVTTADVAYFENYKGFYARPAAEGVFPGVVMIHEWWGLNDNIKTMARELAKEGYAVLAIDLFGKVVTTPDEARKEISSLDKTKALENLKAAVAYLRSKGSEKVGSLGWCFGGGQSLALALSGEKLDATVIYYGNLVTDKKKHN